MKRLICIVMLILVLTGCAQTVECNVTMDQLIEVYKAQEYIIWTETYEAADDGSIGYVQANHINGNYVLFTYFSTPEQAQAYAKSTEPAFWDQLIGFFSSEDDNNVHIEVYGNICVEYLEEVYCQPFLNLLG